MPFAREFYFPLTDHVDTASLIHQNIFETEGSRVELIGDPYYSNVKSLLNFNGSDASTTITDTKGIHTWAAVADAQLDTAVKKYGSAALLLDGTGDYAKTENNLSNFQLGATSWTMEEWGYLSETTGAAQRFLFGFGGGAANWSITNGHGFIMFVNNNGLTYFQYNNGGSPVSLTWTHVNLSSDFHFIQMVNNATANTFIIKIDGTTVYSGAKITITNISTPLRFSLGSEAGGSSPWKGWIDDFRFTPGIARPFAIPTAEFAPSYPTTSPSPATVWTPLKAGDVIDMSTAKVWRYKDDAIILSLTDTDVMFKYAANGGADSAALTLSQLRAETDVTITDETNSFKIYGLYASDGGYKSGSEYFIRFDGTSADGGGGGYLLDGGLIR